MTFEAAGHTVERKFNIDGELYYKCIECGLRGTDMVDFDRHGCQVAPEFETETSDYRPR